jgi:phosphatidate cytidylyltransferase
MTGEPWFLGLVAGVVALLAAFTLAGQVLAHRARTPGQQEVAANLNARVRSWWLMIALFGTALVLGPVVTLLLFGLLSFLALREFLSLTPTRIGDHRALFWCFFVFLPAQYALIGISWYGLFAVLIPVYAFLILPSLAAVAGDTKDFLARCATVQWALMLAVYAVSHAPALLMLHIPGYGLPPAMLLLYLMVVVQISDVFQYVCGKLFGRRRLAPSVSPSKTVEGLAGGGLVAIGVGTGLAGITPFSPLQAAGMSALIVVFGFLGGFALSAIKRDLGVKDWGRAIEGHGGVLDRLDSVCFAAPVFFHFTRYWFAG